MRRRDALPSFSLLLLAPRLAAGATIVAVRVWPADEYTRVTIESEAGLKATHALHQNPHRLSIDIDGLELSTELRELVGKVRGDDPYIAGVRIGQFTPRVVRLVLDLKQPVKPQLFSLPPVAAYRHRLVFDLYPTVEPDPLLALITEKEAAEKRAAEAMRDALGEFLGNLGKRPRDAEPTAPKVDRLVIVALDPGHGGEDPGAVGPSGLREKDVVLALALRLRDELNALPSMRVMLTRDGDYFVPLADRVRKARRVQADLFVSIHADAFVRPEARGSSVFALSDRGATSAAARWLAERENAADTVGGVYVKSKDHALLRAMADMSTTAQIKHSLKLGGEVLRRLGRVGSLHKREVEQAGFAVLKAPDIPSILVETGFVSNPEEEARLRDAGYRERLVEALTEGIKRYFQNNPPMARNRAL